MVQLRIKEICKGKGMSVNSLAEMVGVAQPTLSRIINGKQTPALDTLDKIATALGVEVGELFSKSDPGVFTCPNCGRQFKVTELSKESK